MHKIMATLLTAGVTVIGAQPAFAEDPAKGPIRASAERLASETELEQADVGRRRSGARVGLGVALAAAATEGRCACQRLQPLWGLFCRNPGVAMLLIDPQQPTQPTQPGTVSSDALTRESAMVAVRELYAVWPQTGRDVILVCEPRCFGDIDRAISDTYVSGLAFGHAATQIAIDEQPWTLYQGSFRPFIPYEDRSPGLKYGGAALAVTGALIAGLWSTVPMSNSLTFGVTPGGAQVGKTFGF